MFFSKWKIWLETKWLLKQLLQRRLIFNDHLLKLKLKTLFEASLLWMELVCLTERENIFHIILWCRCGTKVTTSNSIENTGRDWFTVKVLGLGGGSITLQATSAHTRFMSEGGFLPAFNPLYPNILHTVLHTFPKVLTRRIYVTINQFFSFW